MLKVIQDVFLMLMLNILKIYITNIMIYPFLLERMKVEKVKKLIANLHYRTEYVTQIRNLEKY